MTTNMNMYGNNMVHVSIENTIMIELVVQSPMGIMWKCDDS